MTSQQQRTRREGWIVNGAQALVVVLITALFVLYVVDREARIERAEARQQEVADAVGCLLIIVGGPPALNGDLYDEGLQERCEAVARQRAEELQIERDPVEVEDRSVDEP